MVARASRDLAAKRLVDMGRELLNAAPPVHCAPIVIDALSASCRDNGLKFLPMVSRAYHDSLFISRIAPAGMLFIPCCNGYSHRPDEFASLEDIPRGTLILAETLAKLSA